MTVIEILIVLFGLLVVGLLATIWLQLCVLGTIISNWQARMEMQNSWATELQADKILDAINRLDFIPKWKPDRHPY